MIALLDPRQAVLNVAWSLRWVTETHGANRGEAVDAIIRAAGLDPDHPPPGLKSIPWCACYVAYAGYAALRNLWPLKKVAGCVSLYDDAKAKGLIRTVPARGQIFLLHNGTRFHHTGFVEEVLPNGAALTLEGNTNAGGSPEGTGVFQRRRTFGPETRFIDWWEAP